MTAEKIVAIKLSKTEAEILQDILQEDIESWMEPLKDPSTNVEESLKRITVMAYVLRRLYRIKHGDDKSG